ncbi:MAG: IPT/TIG domain-containing protein [Bryobacteraceae bacterium]|jgi:uncharacterized protein (TIGR03437 family)
MSYRFILVLILCCTLYGQKPTTCSVNAAPLIVHSEGVAERLGDIVLTCTGTPGTAVTASLSANLPVTITNRINSSGYSTDANITIDTGSGPVASGVMGRVTNQSISFSGFTFVFPAGGVVTVVLDDLRANVNELGLQQNAPIQVLLDGSLALSNNPVVVANAQLGLLATTMDSGVTCTGSPVPSTVTLGNLIAGKTAEQTTRVTEGFPSSFQPKDPTSDTGTRFLLTYTGFPAGATIYVPDAVAGSSATVPTSGGDMGRPATVGQYMQNSQTLLLVRVLGTDANGAGGTLATLPAPNSAGVLVLNGANPVPLTDGSGYAVYEVAAANPSATESAQIPNYFGIAADTAPADASGSLSLAPVSTVGTASTSAPIPRFVAVTPPPDCQVVGDCNASYYPQLQVTSTANPLTGTGVAGGKKFEPGNITINNIRGGVLDWSANVTYPSSGPTGWVSFTQQFGIDNAIIEVVVDPSSLMPGTYTATITINGGGVAGSQSIPLSVTIDPVTTAPTVTVSSVTDAADFHAGPVVPGSLATVWGSNLSGQNVSVTFNGTAANLLYSGAQQINLQIPAALSGQASTQMLVTVDGSNSTPFTVQLTTVAPAVFTPGVLNQDSSVNSATNPAAVGSVLQIFGTGIPATGAVASVTIQNQSNLTPLYAGAAPGLMGVQQVNVVIPEGVTGSSANLVICVAGAKGQPVCSQPEAITIKP